MSPLSVTGGGRTCSPHEIEPTDVSILYWPGALPMFAVSELEVTTVEEQARLTSLARQFSNIGLPVPVTVGKCEPIGLTIPTSPPECEVELSVPGNEDAIRGSMNMAIWAVPRIDPWLDVLVASLSINQEHLKRSVRTIEANWWRFPPWVTAPNSRQVRGLQGGLWRAAADVFRDRSDKISARPAEIAEQVAGVAVSRYAVPKSK